MRTITCGGYHQVFREVKARGPGRETISTKRNWDPRYRTELSFVRKKEERMGSPGICDLLGWSIGYGLLIGSAFIFLGLNMRMFVWFHLTEEGGKHKSSSREGAGKSTLESAATAPPYPHGIDKYTETHGQPEPDSVHESLSRNNIHDCVSVLVGHLLVCVLTAWLIHCTRPDGWKSGTSQSNKWKPSLTTIFQFLLSLPELLSLFLPGPTKAYVGGGISKDSLTQLPQRQHNPLVLYICQSSFSWELQKKYHPTWFLFF